MIRLPFEARRTCSAALCAMQRGRLEQRWDSAGVLATCAKGGAIFLGSLPRVPAATRRCDDLEKFVHCCRAAFYAHNANLSSLSLSCLLSQCQARGQTSDFLNLFCVKFLNMTCLLLLSIHLKEISWIQSTDSSNILQGYSSSIIASYNS